MEKEYCERRTERQRRLARIVKSQDLAYAGKDILQIVDEIHKEKANEKDKLEEKDEAFVTSVGIIRASLAPANPGFFYMPHGTRLLFLTICDIFDQIEQILWELKGLPGDPPKSTPGTPTS